MDTQAAEDVVSMMLDVAFLSDEEEVAVELAPDALWWDELPGQPV